MRDLDVAELLDSKEPLVVVEAPAGCGKTFQGAGHAQRSALAQPRGRVLILTHTHSACSQFARETKAVADKIEIKTIDSLIVQAAAAYHKSLDIPADPSAWARQQAGDGFKILGARVSRLLASRPMIAAALSSRYPTVIADEHQDCNEHQHSVVMALLAAGSRLRIFGDPMQAIYGRGKEAAAQCWDRWNGLRAFASFAQLENPHRWDGGSPELGHWILQARETLRVGGSIDLTGVLPRGLKVLFADNVSRQRMGFQLSREHRRSIDSVINSSSSMFVLSSHNTTVDALRGFWNRRFPIWEGHSREPLGKLVAALESDVGDPIAIAGAMLSFVEEVCKGFTRSSHGARLLQEIGLGCKTATTGKPALIQGLASYILNEPSHIGVAKCLARIKELVEGNVDGFKDVCIDYKSEFRDAIGLGRFLGPEEGLAEITRHRSFAHPMPPPKSISTIHKAKGLECENALVVPCDSKGFPNSDAARCRLYVALSRARRELTIVASADSPSPLLRTS